MRTTISKSKTLTLQATLVLAGVAVGASCHGGADGGVGDSGSPVDSGASDGGRTDAGDSGVTPDSGVDGGAPDSGLDGGDAGPPFMPDASIASLLVDTRFVVADHMRAGWEMQLSGEPFAQLLNYNLTGFARTDPITDQYYNPATGLTVNDPLGYVMAIETYEYSKQPMNNLSFESGAGLSLMYGPVLNPDQETGDAGFQILLDRFQLFAAESNSGGPLGQTWVVSPAPTANPLNYYGFPGWWPQFAEFESFDPAIQPSPGNVNWCTFGGTVGSLGYGGLNFHGSPTIANYECDYNSLNLPNRDAQVTKVLLPDALGYAARKQGIWAINYWGTLQDTAGNGIISVSADDIPQVGQPGNTVVGFYANPCTPTGLPLLPGAPGVYLGDIPLEGWQGLTMMDEIDNKSAFILGSLTSGDGLTLSPLTVAAADAYAYNSPLVYFPGAVAVVETPTTTDPAAATKYFPQPTSLSIQDGTSRLAALSGLLGGFGEAFALTDLNNSQVGGSVPFEATFDGDPFPLDDGLPDGENTLHDRSLGILKIALVDLDRVHWNAANGVLVDQATIANNGAVTQQPTITTLQLEEAVVNMRLAWRSLSGVLQLYSNDTPDSANMPSALDVAPLAGAPYAGTLEAHIATLIRAEADFLANNLIAPSGAVANGYDLATQTADPSPTLVESETGAIRALLEAYLVTSDEKYRTLAQAVYGDLNDRFWMPDIRVYRTTAGVDSPMQYNPTRFGLISGALRQYYKLVASDPSTPAVGTDLLAKFLRINKLVLNGWDDRNLDNVLQYPMECLAGRLEMGERALTGELGHPSDKGDRDNDCVWEISVVGLPAALGNELDITRLQ